MALSFDELDAFAADLTTYDFMGEVRSAVQQVAGTLRGARQKKKGEMMTLRTMTAVSELDDSLRAMDADVNPVALVNADPQFAKDAKVWARYEEDGLYYEATVVRAGARREDTYLVVFEGYGNEQETALEHLRPFVPVEQLVAREEQPQQPVQQQVQQKAVQAAPPPLHASQLDQDELAAAAEILNEVSLLEQCMKEAEPSVSLRARSETVNGPPPKSHPLPVGKGTLKGQRETLRARKEEQTLRAQREAAALAEEQARYDELERKRQQELLEIDALFDEASAIVQSTSLQAPPVVVVPDLSVQEEQPVVEPAPAEAVAEVLPSKDELQDAAAELAKKKGERNRVLEMQKSAERELKELTQRKFIRQQYRQEVVEESLTAVTSQRAAIRVEIRSILLLCKKTALSCGRLHTIFVANVRDMTSAAKTALTMIAILVSATQFKTVAAKLHVLASNMQKEIGRLIQHFRAQHVALTEAGSVDGADVACLAKVAEMFQHILSATNEIVAATEHSAAVLKTRTDPADVADDEASVQLMIKLSKAKQALELLDRRILQLEQQLTVKPGLSRTSLNRNNPSRRR